MLENVLNPDYLFEVSWEVCNQIGGMHTVLSSKARSIVQEMENNYLVVGPDLVHDSGTTPEFKRDDEIYADWRIHAESKGFRIKVGRWKVAGEPIAVLIDFSNFFDKKDDIFKEMWEAYKLDSLSGQWDYVEPVLFGYAAGKLIENFILFNLSKKDKVVCQFHEWMSSCGILYLKKSLPQAATIFTTHATILGRTLSGHYKPLYEEMEHYHPEEVAREYKIVSKQSLEKISAREADVFTTVSDITAIECKYFLGKEVDMILPNGFDTHDLPSEQEFKTIRQTARSKMLQVASSLLDQKIPDNAYIVATSGRYEFKNKGIDLFIDTISALRERDLDRPVIAFLLNPANHYGARKDLLESISNGKTLKTGSKILTHYLHDPDMDPILKRIENNKLEKNDNKNVKIIYVPCYLNKSDGIFNLSYYDILVGCDQTVFASYYEPWGYTPLESIVYGIPTVTTLHAGIGRWIKDVCQKDCKSISIIDTGNTTDQEVVGLILDSMLSMYGASEKEKDEIRNNAFKLSKTALWSSLLANYKNAFSVALNKTIERSDSFIEADDHPTIRDHKETVVPENQPNWKRIIIRSKLPGPLEKLNEIASNIWWTWDDEAQELFEYIAPPIWKESDFNPEIVFEQVAYKRLKNLARDNDYLNRLNAVYDRFKAYMEGQKELSSPKIAYFSMEFGFHDCLKLYSGGLGILAGDYLKEASDAKVNIVAIGLLYRYGYFTQVLTTQGEQQAIYDYQHFSKMPILPVKDEEGNFKIIQIVLPGRIMYARIWEMKVGRINLLLLDTDFEMNLTEDRGVTHHLYGGDRENRLKQELLLGVGGIRALNIMGFKPDLYHSNEGHSAFNGIERVRQYMLNEQLTFDEAREIVRSSTLFTTHTPVPAGHDHFDEEMLRKYLGHYPNRIKLSWDQFMGLGRANPKNWKEEFNMSYLATHFAQEVNGVSMLHGAVTREMFTELWPGYLAEELPIGYVTNGVHWPTWTSKEWKAIYNEMFEGNFVDNQLNRDMWNRIYDYDDKRIWDLKQQLRSKLINTVKERFKENWIKRHEDPSQILAINNRLSDKALTIVFARRFATYKRAHLLFNNPERLSKLLNNPDMPLQFIFAGKAHPADKAGQGLIKMITEYSKMPEFLGKILFLQNYSIGLAKLLVSGADIWMNTPTRPLEASGTSGEKAVMNGTLHFSVLDGWWVEGYKPDAGWALTNERTYENQNFQDNLDAEIIYSLLENEILPAFYNRNEQGYSHQWVSFIKNTISGVSPKFTTRRMISDYKERFYSKLYSRSKEMLDNEYAQAKDIANWKRKMVRAWNNIEVVKASLFDPNMEMLNTGTNYKGEVSLRLDGINPKHIGVELITTEDMKELVEVHTFKFESSENGVATFTCDVKNDRPGTFSYGIRVFPMHERLPNRQDFGLLKWI